MRSAHFFALARLASLEDFCWTSRDPALQGKWLLLFMNGCCPLQSGTKGRHGADRKCQKYQHEPTREVLPIYHRNRERSRSGVLRAKLRTADAASGARREGLEVLGSGDGCVLRARGV